MQKKKRERDRSSWIFIIFFQISHLMSRKEKSLNQSKLLNFGKLNKGLQRKKNEASESELWKIMKLANTHRSKAASPRGGGVLINKACVYTRMIAKWHWNDFLIHFLVGRRRFMNEEELTPTWQTQPIGVETVFSCLLWNPGRFFVPLAHTRRLWCFRMHLHKGTPPWEWPKMIAFKFSKKNRHEHHVA